MRIQLGINTCFAVKRWPLPEDWAPIVRDELGLRLVQHSLDLVDLHADEEGLQSQADALQSATAAHDLELHSTFTGLAAYSSNLLLSPDAAEREAADAWLRAAIGFTAISGAQATGGHVGCFSVADWHDTSRRSELWTGLQAALRDLAIEARARGLDYLVVENLAVAREPSTMAMIRELLDDGGTDRVPIRLCLDVGHMCVPGTSGADRDPYAWIRTLGLVAPGHPAPAIRCGGRPPLAVHGAVQRRRPDLGGPGDRGARRGRRPGERPRPGGHPALRAGRGGRPQ